MVNFIYGVLRKQAAPNPIQRRNFVTFRIIFPRRFSKGNFNLLFCATEPLLFFRKNALSPSPKLVRSAQKRTRFFYICTTCTKHAILTNYSLFRSVFPSYEPLKASLFIFAPGCFCPPLTGSIAFPDPLTQQPSFKQSHSLLPRPCNPVFVVSFFHILCL